MSTQKEKLMEASVTEIMEENVPFVNVDENVKTAAELMEKKEFGCLIVIDEDIAVGMVTEYDIVIKVTAEAVDPTKVLVQDIMSSPLISVTTGASVKEAAEQMSTFKVRKLVVTDDNGKLVGLVTSIDLAKWLASQENYSDLGLNALAKVGPLKDSPYV
jgi:CBS domain-containing protein